MTAAVAAAGAAIRTRTLPIIEVFGPVIQGEGILAGAPTHFIRVGGCDYRCSWCDSLFAVIPSEVRANAEKLTVDEVLERVDALSGRPRWVTLSGGNPALLELGELVTGLQRAGWQVCVETQGSRWRDWLGEVDCLTVSPKPPSSGMDDKTARNLPGFMARARAAGRPDERDALKIVVFTADDFVWARTVLLAHPDWPAFVSCGTDPWTAGETFEETLGALSVRYRLLCELVSADPALAHVRVLPQLHVLAFGHARGV